MKNYFVNGIEIKRVFYEKDKNDGRHNILYYELVDGTICLASKTLVQAICNVCKKTINIKIYKYRSQFKIRKCLSCATKIRMNSYSPDEKANIYKKRTENNKNKTVEQKKQEHVNRVIGAKKMWERDGEQRKQKYSKMFSGKGNPMYGKSIKNYMSPEKYEEWKLHEKQSAYSSKSFDEQQKISEKLRLSQKKLQEKDPKNYSEMKARDGRATRLKVEVYQKTKPEQILEQWLIDNNVNYEYSCIMGSGDTCFQYDFIIHKKRILIEVQGDYWHGNPEIYNEDGSDGKRKLNDIQKKKIKYDKLKLQFAQEKNFNLICIWEHEILNNDYSKLKIILDREQQ